MFINPPITCLQQNPLSTVHLYAQYVAKTVLPNETKQQINKAKYWWGFRRPRK